jgi:hypothetical protein
MTVQYARCRVLQGCVAQGTGGLAASGSRSPSTGRVRAYVRGRARAGGLQWIGPSTIENGFGRVAEWFKAPVLKTGRGSAPSWVRIPPLPPIDISMGYENSHGPLPERVRQIRLIVRDQPRPPRSAMKLANGAIGSDAAAVLAPLVAAAQAIPGSRVGSRPMRCAGSCLPMPAPWCCGGTQTGSPYPVGRVGADASGRG